MEHGGAWSFHAICRYTALIASMIFCLAARTAGRKPPKNPIIMANAIDSSMMAGEREKEKASSENVEKLMVDIVIV